MKRKEEITRSNVEQKAFDITRLQHDVFEILIFDFQTKEDDQYIYKKYEASDKAKNFNELLRLIVMTRYDCDENFNFNGSYTTQEVQQINDFIETAKKCAAQFFTEETSENAYIAFKLQSVSNELKNTVDQSLLTVDELKEYKINQMGLLNTALIEKGIDVNVNGQEKHFSLSAYDQLNLFGLKARILEGATVIPYHADGEYCALYDVEEMNQIIKAAEEYVMYNTTRCNMLNMWIRRSETREEVERITFDSVLPDDLQAKMYEILQGAQAQ